MAVNIAEDAVGHHAPSSDVHERIEGWENHVATLGEDKRAQYSWSTESGLKRLR